MTQLMCVYYYIYNYAIIYMCVYYLDEEILMKDENGHIVLYNVNNLNTTVLAMNTTQVIMFRYYFNTNNFFSTTFIRLSI